MCMKSVMSEQKFEAAVNVIRSLPKDGPYQPSHDMMLRFYGLYKQATEGQCTEAKPAFYELVKGYKWKAWSSLGDMSKGDAMEAYVDELKKIIETMSYSADVAKFIEALGPFYEYVESPKRTKTPLKDVMKNEKNNRIKRTNGLLNGGFANHLPTTNGFGPDEADEALTNGIDELPVSYSKLNGYIPHEDDSDEEAVMVSSSLLKLSPDSDSEEEYSEPAETLELLHQKEKHQGYTEEGRSTSINIMTFGGGDAAEAGRIRMASPQQQHIGAPSSVAQLPPSENSSLMSTPMHGGGGGRRRRDSDRPGSSKVSEEISSQLVMLLQKIHDDLQNVVLRLESLEAQTVNQHREVCSICQRRAGHQFSSPVSDHSWWPFPELSPRSTFFLLTWPLILHGAMRLLLLLRSRRRNRDTRLL